MFINLTEEEIYTISAALEIPLDDTVASLQENEKSDIRQVRVKLDQAIQQIQAAEG